MKNNLQEISDIVFPLFGKFSSGDNYGISLGGSRSMGTFADDSDFDFKIFCEKPVNKIKKRLMNKLIRSTLTKKNIHADFRVRSYDEIDRQLDLWLNGVVTPESVCWSAWGYHLPVEIHHQIILRDPYGKLQEWKNRVAKYPSVLEKAIIKKYKAVLTNWFDNPCYSCNMNSHYMCKIEKNDFVFTSSHINVFVHAILQILYAKNHVYYPGDGNNLFFTQSFKIKPDNFENRVAEILYPGKLSEDTLSKQFFAIKSLCHDVIKLI